VQRDCSEQTARGIDLEVKSLLAGACAEAQSVLREHRAQLDFVARELLEHETLDGATFKRLLHQGAPPSEALPGVPRDQPPAAVTSAFAEGLPCES